jgi:hypothetical protein
MWVETGRTVALGVDIAWAEAKLRLSRAESLYSTFDDHYLLRNNEP